jgi:hypothetical protein
VKFRFLPALISRARHQADPLLQQIRMYWLLALLAILAPIAIGIPYLHDAVAAASILSLIAAAWHVYRYLVHSRRISLPRVFIGGLLALSGAMVVAILVSTVYVIRHGRSFPGHVGPLLELTGIAYLVLAHFLIHRFTTRRWPVTPIAAGAFLP